VFHQVVYHGVFTVLYSLEFFFFLMIVGVFLWSAVVTSVAMESGLVVVGFAAFGVWQ